MADFSKVSTTAGYSLGVTGTAAVLKWGLVCIVAHKLQMPDDATILVMAGGIFPIVHEMRDVLRSLFFREAGIRPEFESIP